MDNQLIEIYTTLFSELGYKKDNDIPNFFFNYELNSFYICTIIHEEHLDQWMGEQINIYNSVMNKQENPHRVKNNMTHLVFYITEKKDQSFVFELEEDEYYFKKHVIVLNHEEISDFNNQFENSQYKSYQLFFENKVDDNSCFENYKKNRSKNYYSMILKFYIKIPSLYLSKSVSSSELQTLKKSIEKELAEINLLDFSNQLIEVMDPYIALDEELKNLDIETLNKWVGEINDEK